MEDDTRAFGAISFEYCMACHFFYFVDIFFSCTCYVHISPYLSEDDICMCGVGLDRCSEELCMGRRCAKLRFDSSTYLLDGL